jgi:hypothetical protein
MTAPVIREHDNAVHTAVAAIGRQTGLVDAPPGALDSLLNQTGDGYYIIYPIPGGDRDGPVNDPYTDITLHYQITCVDAGPEGCRWLTDQIETALANLTVPDRAVMWINPTAPSGIFPDDDTAAQRLFYSTPSYQIATTPT